jgi:hypothetical protein
MLPAYKWHLALMLNLGTTTYRYARTGYENEQAAISVGCTTFTYRSDQSPNAEAGANWARVATKIYGKRYSLNHKRVPTITIAT